jgi:hypothetical protein
MMSEAEVWEMRMSTLCAPELIVTESEFQKSDESCEGKERMSARRPSLQNDIAFEIREKNKTYIW